MNSLSSKPFAKKFFYVDLKGFPNEKKLIKDLELLGGKQEVFLSKTVSFVVSNRISLTESGSPSTPVSNNKSISPYFFKDCSFDNRDSPASNSPGFEQKLHNESFVPLSRGMSVLQKARQKCQGSNKVILDICKQWNIKVYPVQKVISWIEKYKSKYCIHSTAKPKRELVSENVTRLYSPFVKIEDKQRNYKPRYKDFSSWSKSTDSFMLQSANKFIAHFKQFGNLDFSARLPLKEIFIQPQTSNQSKKTTCITEARECSVLKASGYNSSKAGRYNNSKATGYNSFSNSVLISGVVGKQTETGSRSIKAKKEKHAKKKRLYCEICSVYYSDGEAHYEKNSHARFQNNVANYRLVQKEIDDLPTADDFINSILAKDVVCEEVNEVCEDTLMEVECCRKENQDNCLKSNEKDKEETCVTEVYSVNGNDFISASCSSPGTPLPYLEKTEGVHAAKDVDLAPPLLVDSNLTENQHDTFRSHENLNPPLLLLESYDVPLESTDNYLHVAATQNIDKRNSGSTWYCNGLGNDHNLIADESLTGLVNLSQNFMEDASVVVDTEIIQNRHTIPANLAQDFIHNAPENEINAIPLEQAQSFLQQPLINLYDNVEHPLDLSNYSKNNENEGQMIVNSYSMDNIKDLNIMNGNLLHTVKSSSLISTHVNSKNSVNALDCETVNKKSEAESFGSEPNLAGFDAIINNCLEEVTKSLVNDSSTADEDGPSNGLQCQNSNVGEFTANLKKDTESKPSVIPCTESALQTGKVQEQLVEDPVINHQQSSKTIGHFNIECDTTVHTSAEVTYSYICPMEFTANIEKNEEDKSSVVSCTESVPQTGEFQEQLVEEPVINPQPIRKTIEHHDIECDTTVCAPVKVTCSNICPPSVMEATTLFHQNPLVAARQDSESLLSASISENQNESVYHDKDTSTSLENLSFQRVCPLSDENPERFGVFGLTSSLVKSIQARVSSELLHSGDAYLVLDEADSSFNAVKEEGHASKIDNCVGQFIRPETVANSLDAFGSLHETTGIKESGDIEHIQLEYTLNATAMNKTTENNMCDIVRSSSVDLANTIGKESEEFSETENNPRDSLTTKLVSEAEVKGRVYCDKMVHQVTDTVCEMKDNGVADNKQEYPHVIKDREEVVQNSIDCSNADGKMVEKKIETVDYSEMKPSSFNPVQKTEKIDDLRVIKNDVKNIMMNIISKVCESEDKGKICSNKREYSTTNTVCKTSQMEISGNKGGCHNEANEKDTADWDEMNFSVKRESESKEPACKRMKFSSDDSIMNEKSSNSINMKHQFNGAVVDIGRDSDSENNIMKHPSVTETVTNLESHLFKRQFSENSGVHGISSTNDSLNSSSSSFESSFCSSNGSDTSLLEGISPSCFPVVNSSADGLQDIKKTVHIIYINTPRHPNNSIPVTQGGAEGMA